MASPENLATKPRERKRTTSRLDRVTVDYFRTIPGPRNKHLNRICKTLARQARQVPGEGPLPVPEFLRELGLEVPSWYEYQYDRDRQAKRDADDAAAKAGWEKAAVEARKAKKEHAALAAKLAEALAHAQKDHKKEAREREERERLELELAAEDELEAYLRELKRTATICQSSPRSKPVFKNQPTQHPHPAELENRSPRLSKLVLLASVRCLSSLERVAREATPETPTMALEDELEKLLGLLAPAPSKPRKKLWWLDMS